MSWMNGIRARLDQVVRRRAAEERMDEEIRFHLEMETERLVREQGLGPAEARRRAVLAFGGVEGHREEMREGRRIPVVEDFWRDVRYAVRSLRRSPAFTAAAVLCLALGIGVSTAMFSAVDALLLRPLPLEEPDRVVEVSVERSFGGGSASYTQYESLAEGTRTLSSLAGVQDQQVSFGDVRHSEEVRGSFVSGNYFRTLGIHPVFGRLLTPEDDRPVRAAPVVVLSHRMWRDRFGADPAIVGREVRLNGAPVSVVGVAPPEFTGTAITRAPALWAPLALQEEVVPGARTYSPMSFSLALVGRVRPGVALSAAEEELSALARRTESPNELVALTGASLRPVSRIPAAHEDVLLRFVRMLAAASALLLLIASTNVAAMLLVRAVSRRRELAVRSAIGAGRWRLVRQLTTEGVVLFVAGGVGGALLATGLTRLLLTFRWPMPVLLAVGVDPRALGFALGLSVVFGLGVGILAALRASRAGALPGHRGGAQGDSRGGVRLRGTLVVSQVAMTLVLLVGAGLFLRSLQRALGIDPGFSPEGVMVAAIDLHRERFSEEHGRVFHAQILERVRTVPGVEAASLSAAVPLGPGGEMLRIAGADAGGVGEREGAFVHANVVTPDYFRTMEIPLLRGRVFSSRDAEEAPRVAIVNETFAARYWPGADPIGRRFRQEFSAMQMMLGGSTSPEEFEVVGVVPDGKYSSLREGSEPQVFLPLAQDYRSRVVLAVRSRTGTGAVAAAVRAEVRALAPGLPLLHPTPLEHLIADALLPQRIGAVLTSLFGALALLLAAVGVYGVTAYAVGQRTREIGIRMALGAARSHVLRQVLGRGAALALAGVGLGAGVALAATRQVASLLFGVSPTDPATYAAVAALLLTVAALASYLPGRHAARVDPMVALRHE